MTSTKQLRWLYGRGALLGAFLFFWSMLELSIRFSDQPAPWNALRFAPSLVLALAIGSDSAPPNRQSDGMLMKTLRRHGDRIRVLGSAIVVVSFAWFFSLVAIGFEFRGFTPIMRSIATFAGNNPDWIWMDRYTFHGLALYLVQLLLKQIIVGVVIGSVFVWIKQRAPHAMQSRV